MNLHITGTPIALPRPRVTKKSRVYYTARWRAYHRRAVQELRFLQPVHTELQATACSIHITYILPAPKRKPPKNMVHRALWRTDEKYAYPCKPDVDNLVKGTLDILQDAGLLADDAMVVTLSAQKFAATDRSKCGVRIQIYPV